MDHIRDRLRRTDFDTVTVPVRALDSLEVRLCGLYAATGHPDGVQQPIYARDQLGELLEDVRSLLALPSR